MDNSTPKNRLTGVLLFSGGIEIAHNNRDVQRVKREIEQRLTKHHQKRKKGHGKDF